MNKSKIKLVVRVLLALLFIGAGALHFTRTESFIAIMPTYLPAHRPLVLISGFFEIIGGIALLVPALARPAAYGLVALLIAVFPANVNMALNQLPMGDKPVPPLFLWLRLPLQFVLIALVLWSTKGKGQK